MRRNCAFVQRLGIVFLVSSLCGGLELDLDVDIPGQTGVRAPCAVLRCEEERQLHSSSGTNQSQSSLPRNTIVRLTVFKIDRSTSRSSPQGSPKTNPAGIAIASLTPQQPKITRVSNAIKVIGILDSQRASLTLEMVKSIDCMADFLCELRTVDANGKESLSSSRVNQNKKLQKKDGQDNQGSVPSVSWQILEAVHQLDTKLAVANLQTEMFRESFKALDNKIVTFESNLNNKMTSFESRMLNFDSNVNAKLVLLDKSVQQLELKVGALENRVEDKIDSSERSLHGDLSLLQNRLEDKLKDDIEEKLNEVDQKMTTFVDEAKSYSHNAGKSLNKSLTALGEYLETEQSTALSKLNSAAERLMENQNGATVTLLSTARNLSRAQTDFGNEIRERLAQATNKLTKSSANVSETLRHDLTSLGQDLRQNFQELTSNIRQSTAEIVSSANNLFLQTNATATAAIETLFSPKRCTKGMLSVLSSTLYPYPLIQPRGDSVVNVPHLCDTATEGGGWIIIQRRTTGDVDFYRRDWEEYKNGFGDLKGDFWLGNEHIHRITNSGPCELRVELIFQGKPFYARYGKFAIAGEANNYKLNVGDYSGTAGEAMINNIQGSNFTTIDKDNNHSNNRNCAERCMGGWWFTDCGYSSLNGKWREVNYKGPFWHPLTGDQSVSYSELKVRHLVVP